LKEAMSDLILPLGVSLPEQILPMDMPDEDIPMEDRATALPVPTGYKILCVVPDISNRLDGTELDLVRPMDYAKQEQMGTTTLFVMALGEDAYKDTVKFPSGPWCKQGDFVVVRTYTGTRLKIFGKEFRVINDDQVECVVQDPRGITRA
jgi:co-chaperonin GroES (HSP10)